MRVMTIILVLMLIFASVAMASTINQVTHYGTSGSTQIWMNAASLDSTSPAPNDFQQDVSATGTLSGSAYYFPITDDYETVQEWWAEYSIDSNDVNVSGVTLSGNWYFWVRATQPNSNGDEDSDYLFVKGDPCDGSGASWYTDSISAVDDGDDRIVDNMLAVGGVGTWVWHNTWPQLTVSKEFNLDSGKITFRISERESGSDNTRIDMIVWSDDPDYVPSDNHYNGLPNCMGEIEGDLNDDCKIDLQDFSMLAAEWLKSNLVP